MASQPGPFDPGHGPLSSQDERRGGVAGMVVGGLVGYEKAGIGGALVCGALGWGIGEAIDDPDSDEVPTV